MSAHVTVEPERFTLVHYEADTIAAIVTELAELVGVTNPIRLEIDETTPLAKRSATIGESSEHDGSDADSSDDDESGHAGSDDNGSDDNGSGDDGSGDDGSGDDAPSSDDDAPSSDSRITLRLQSGALEDTKHLTHFSAEHARQSIGHVLLRARDRLRGDFADAPDDIDLTNPQNAAWDAYCAGRLERLGLTPVQQQYRYDFRNRFGFRDDVDAVFDRLWAADDLGWHELPVSD